MRSVSVSAGVLVCLCMAPSVGAQETRTAVIEKQRAEKAATLEPYRAGKLEKILGDVESGKVKRMISPHNGFYAQYGYTYKTQGSGIGFGGGFRHDLFNRNARIDLEAGATFRRYWMLRGDFSLPRLMNEHLELGVEAVYHRRPQEDFYGLGPDSFEEDRVSYAIDGPEVTGRAVFKPRVWWDIGTNIGYVGPDVGSGTDDRFPSIEERFTDIQAPGLDRQPGYLFGGLFTEIDYRDEPGNARSGGHYVVTWRRYSDRDFDRYSFNLATFLAQQFVPIFDKKRVFAFQVGLSNTKAVSGNEVPFYVQPSVGGSRTLRSVPEFRFRDNHALWMNVEYRWEAFSALDMALFVDYAGVAPDVSKLGGNMEPGYGIGFRFNTPKVVFLRIDIATGAGHGVQYYFKWSKVF